MTTVVLASSYLSAELLTMLVPIATVIAIVAWGVLLIRRYERRRQEVEIGGRPGGTYRVGWGVALGPGGLMELTAARALAAAAVA